MELQVHLDAAPQPQRELAGRAERERLAREEVQEHRVLPRPPDGGLERVDREVAADAAEVEVHLGVVRARLVGARVEPAAPLRERAVLEPRHVAPGARREPGRLEVRVHPLRRAPVPVARPAPSSAYTSRLSWSVRSVCSAPLRSERDPRVRRRRRPELRSAPAEEPAGARRSSAPRGGRRRARPTRAPRAAATRATSRGWWTAARERSRAARRGLVAPAMDMDRSIRRALAPPRRTGRGQATMRAHAE